MKLRIIRGRLWRESGPSLIDRMTRQAARFGAERACDTIDRVELEGPVKKLDPKKDTYQCRALIIATGALRAADWMQAGGRIRRKGRFLLCDL